MKARRHLLLASLGGLGLALAGLACDFPECDFGPSNLDAQSTASCQAAPSGTPLEDQVYSATATWGSGGELTLSMGSIGMTCGQRADSFGPPENCVYDGWVLSVDLPAELAVPGTIELSEHPEVRGSLSVSDHGGGMLIGSYAENEPFFTGTLELLAVNEDCVTAVLHSFGHDNPDPHMGGPELNGAVVAPVCPAG